VTGERASHAGRGGVAAYGWREAPDDLPDAEIVARLLALNLTREPV
jgi:hypothetical protein